jgi:hypothetical protein
MVQTQVAGEGTVAVRPVRQRLAMELMELTVLAVVEEGQQVVVVQVVGLVS